jgi:predicted transcriptional regulator of viral defense system
MKKLNSIFVLTKLKESKIRIFSILDFQRIFDIDYESAKKAISRYVKRGIFTKIRKGLYFITNDHPLDFEIANKLYFPSYVSFDTALAFYGIIPETVYEITSATTNKSKEFLVNNLKFSYKKIKKECFLGYSLRKIQNRVVLIAEPEKALADFLYFVSLGKRNLEYERINLKKINKERLIKFAKCFKRKEILDLIKKIYD